MPRHGQGGTWITDDMFAAYCDLPPTFEAFLNAILGLRQKLGVPHTLADFKVSAEKREQIADMAIVDPTAGGNPVKLTRELALEIMFTNAAIASAIRFGKLETIDNYIVTGRADGERSVHWAWAVAGDASARIGGAAVAVIGCAARGYACVELFARGLAVLAHRVVAETVELAG